MASTEYSQQELHDLLTSFFYALQVNNSDSALTKNFGPAFELPHKNASELADDVLAGEQLEVTAYFLLDIPETDVEISKEDRYTRSLLFDVTAGFKHFSLQSEAIIKAVVAHLGSKRFVRTSSAEVVMKGIATGDFSPFKTIRSSFTELRRMIERGEPNEQIIIAAMQAQRTKALTTWNFAADEGEADECIIYYCDGCLQLGHDYTQCDGLGADERVQPDEDILNWFYKMVGYEGPACKYEMLQYYVDTLKSLFNNLDERKNYNRESYEEFFRGDWGCLRWENWNKLLHFYVNMESPDVNGYPGRCVCLSGYDGMYYYSSCISRDNIDKFCDIHVPSSGMATTMAGELLRSMSEIQRRWDSHREMITVPYFPMERGEVVNSAFSFIRDNVPLYFLDDDFCITDIDEDKYQKLINELWYHVFRHVAEHPRLAHVKPAYDSRFFSRLSVEDSIQSILNKIASGSSPTATDIELMYKALQHFWINKTPEEDERMSPEDKEARLSILDTYFRLKLYGMIPERIIAIPEDRWLRLVEEIDLNAETSLRTKYKYIWINIQSENPEDEVDFKSSEYFKEYYSDDVMTKYFNRYNYIRWKLNTCTNVPFSLLGTFLNLNFCFACLSNSEFDWYKHKHETGDRIGEIFYSFYNPKNWTSIPMKRRRSLCENWIEESDPAELRIVEEFIKIMFRKSPVKNSLLRMCVNKRKSIKL